MFGKKIKNRITLLSEQDLKTFIDVNTEVLLLAPWNGKPMPVCIKMLDSVALTSCGQFNTVSTIVEENSSSDVAVEDIVKIKNIHENLLKLTLVRPTFKELEEHLVTKDFYKNAKNEITEIKALLKTLTSEVEKETLRQQLDKIELSIAFLIPEDFTAAIVSVLMQGQATDISKLTRDTLLQAGFLGEKYNTRPCEYLSGTFTEKQRVDIDITALTLVADYRDQQKVEKSGMKWIRGKNVS